MNEYAVIIENTHYAISDSVSKMLKKGWQCQGGIALSVNHMNNSNLVEEVFAQAMVRRIAPPKKDRDDRNLKISDEHLAEIQKGVDRELAKLDAKP